MSEVSLKELETNIYISGFMASGKSTIGKKIAALSGLNFIDLDKVIEERESMSIVSIFDTYGEAYFREKERQYLMEFPGTFHGVISLGGGALQDQQVVDTLKEDGILVFIDTPLPRVVERVYDKKHRPILYDEEGKIKTKEALFEELKLLYLSRINYYKQAQVSLDTTKFTSSNMTAKAAIEKIKGHV